MTKLIIPRGVAPRLYRKLVASGEVKGQYREEPKYVDKDELLDFMNKQEKAKPKLTVWKQGAGNV
ncbi:hypothetical protein LCGC14_2450010 [marine sediment metagenome]|uniref:Uncharacterized protein n=1 Tax=marine sediment metagenome TaxID=412755 RepID=A0A0F9EAA2_9ZZZZ